MAKNIEGNTGRCGECESCKERIEFERASRDCKVQGHHWEYFYGARSQCKNCHIEG